MHNPTLVILAAGLSTRYSGPKQIEPVGPDGEALLDYAVYDALSQLRPTHRKCVVMHVLERRTYEEIAQELDLPVGTVKSHVARAFKKLRALLGHVLDSSDPEMTPLNDDYDAAGEPGS